MANDLIYYFIISFPQDYLELIYTFSKIQEIMITGRNIFITVAEPCEGGPPFLPSPWTIKLIFKHLIFSLSALYSYLRHCHHMHIFSRWNQAVDAWWKKNWIKRVRFTGLFIGNRSFRYKVVSIRTQAVKLRKNSNNLKYSLRVNKK